MLSRRTIANAHTCLSLSWNWVAEEDNIASQMCVPRPRAMPKPIAPLTKDDAKAILNACDFSFDGTSN